MILYFNYSIDCELPADSGSGVAASWAEAENSVRQFVETMAELGLAAGATLFVYPDVARRQSALFRELAGAGFEFGLHLNGRCYSRLQGARAKWLGAMSRDEQREALCLAKQDLEDALGQAIDGYRACCASANDDTFPLCEELGFTWSSTIFPDLQKPKVHASWAGAWRYPHHPSAGNRLLRGGLALYEMPITNGANLRFGNGPERPLDLRAETPPRLTGPKHDGFREIIAGNLAEMSRRNQPVRMIVVGSHNKNPFADPAAYQHQNLLAVVRLTKEISAVSGLTFIPAKFETVRQEAVRINAF